MDFTLEECQEWLTNKEVNPRTQRIISENGTVYKKLYKLCIQYELIENDELKNYSVSEMKRLSKLWSMNKDINPITGMKIKPSSKIYKKLKSWYIMFHDVKENNIQKKISSLVEEINNEDVDVDEYLNTHHPDMVKYKNNIIRELNKL